MPESDRLLAARRALLRIGPAALLRAQIRSGGEDPSPSGVIKPDEPTRLPNGKNQQNEIAKADYENNLKDARDLIDMARSFEEDLEKDDRFVLSISSLKKLDEIDKLTRRIRGRLKRI